MKNWTKQDEEALQALTARKAQADAAYLARVEHFEDAVTGQTRDDDAARYAVGWLFEKCGQKMLDMLLDFYEPSPRAMPESNEYGARDKFIPGLPVAPDQQLAKR